MNADPEHSDLPAVDLLHEPGAAAALLKPPRPALLAALRQPDSASGLARRLGMPRQRLNHHLRELERLGFVELLLKRRRGNFTERILRASARRYLICPEVIGELGTVGAEDLREPLIRVPGSLPALNEGVARRDIVETHRLLLRELVEGDAEAVFVWSSDPEVMRYTPDPARSAAGWRWSAMGAHRAC